VNVFSIFPYHDKEDIPDEETNPSGSAARERQGGMLVGRLLVNSFHNLLSRKYVSVKIPLLFINERLDVDAGQLTRVLLYLHLCR